MKKTLATLMFALPLLLCSSGCTDSGQTSSVTADAKKSAIEEYQAMIEADEAAMNAAAPPDLKLAPPKAAAAGKAAAQPKAAAAGKAAAQPKAATPGNAAAQPKAATPATAAAPTKAATPDKEQ